MRRRASTTALEGPPSRSAGSSAPPSTRSRPQPNCAPRPTGQPQLDQRHAQTCQPHGPGGSSLQERGFERTTIDQIAASADISRRTFFRYFADKKELFFAEDERLLQVIENTLDGAPDGGPVLELARRATHALAAHSVADPERRLARERVVAATPAPQARRGGQT